MAPDEIGTLAGAPIGTEPFVSTINVAFLRSLPAYTYILAVEDASRYIYISESTCHLFASAVMYQ